MTLNSLMSRSIPIPPVPTIERPRLLNDLHPALQHKLTIVAAPPGFGKTTLVSQFAQQVETPVIWQTIEESDHDIPNLYAHTLTALSDITPGIRELNGNPRNGAVELVSHIVNYLRDHVSEDMVYILDDAQYVVGTPAGDMWLRTLVSTLPANCHLMLISRTMPNLPVDILTHRDMLTIGHAKLRFTPEEIMEFAQQIDAQGGLADANDLMARLDGWPAGVVLALQPMPPEFESTFFTEEARPEALFNNLAQQMLNRQSSALRRFLIISSTLARVTPHLCQHALKLPDSAVYLTEAMQRNLFLHQVPGGFVYHSLFRDFLQRQFQAQSPDEFIKLHRQAGEWFESMGQLDEAFSHYITGQLWFRAAQVAQQAAQSLFMQGKVATLLKWNSQLVEINISAPQLHYACAMIHVDRYQYDQALTELAKASEGFERLADTNGLFQVELILGTIDNQRGEYQAAAQRANHLLKNPAVPDHLRGHLLVTLGQATLQLGDAETALKHFETALPLHRAVGDTFGVTQVLQYLELAYIRLGRFDDAGVCLQEIVAKRREFGSTIALGLALNDLGYYYHQLGKYQEALHTFEDGLKEVSNFPQRRAESVLRWSAGDLKRDCGALREAYSDYMKALEYVTDSEPSLRCGLLNSLAILRRWQGDMVDAGNSAQEAFELANRFHLALEQTKAEMSLSVLEAQTGDPVVALEKLDHLAKVLHHQQAFPRLAQSWALCAYVALLQGDEAKATRYLKCIDQTIPNPANLQLCIAEIQHTDLLKAFIVRRKTRYPLLIEELERLEQAQMQEPPDDRAVSEAPSPTLTLRVITLGQERVERNGIPVATSSWRMMARSLFYYLLFQGAVSLEQVCVVFWPDGISNKVKHNFHTTLSRVRRVLGENAITFQNERYFVSQNLDLWCDAFEFEALVKEARLLAPRTPHAESLWRRAVNLYKGDFLPKIDQEWATVRREKLREIDIEALVGLGNCLRTRDDFPGAIDYYKRAIKIDPYREDIHRMILSVYGKQGKRQQIVKHYDALIKLLDEELGVEPSEETRRLVDDLLA